MPVFHGTNYTNSLQGIIPGVVGRDIVGIPSYHTITGRSECPIIVVLTSYIDSIIGVFMCDLMGIIVAIYSSAFLAEAC